MDGIMKVCIYARESSDDLKKSPSIETQISCGLEWIKKNDYVLVEVFKDDGFSGGAWNRPGWLKCINAAKRNAIQAVWTWKQDRIARDTEQFLYFYRIMKENQIRVFESGGEIDLNSAGNRLKHTVISASDELFRLVTSEKVKAVYQHKKAVAEREGVPLVWGHPRLLDEKTRKAIFRDYVNEEGSYRTLAKKYNVSHQTIKRIVNGDPEYVHPLDDASLVVTDYPPECRV